MGSLLKDISLKQVANQVCLRKWLPASIFNSKKDIKSKTRNNNSKGKACLSSRITSGDGLSHGSSSRLYVPAPTQTVHMAVEKEGGKWNLYYFHSLLNCPEKPRTFLSWACWLSESSRTEPLCPHQQLHLALHSETRIFSIQSNWTQALSLGCSYDSHKHLRKGSSRKNIGFSLNFQLYAVQKSTIAWL